MKIVSCYTPNLKPLIGPMVYSLDLYAPDHLVIEHEADQIKTFSLAWPKNRFFYCTAQGGEFIDLSYFREGELICLIDADVVMQREITEDELKMISPEKGEFTVNYISYPPRSLNEATASMMCTKEVVSRDNYVELGAAVMIAHKEDWVKLRDIYIPFFKSLRRSMWHHATTQWLISHILQWKFKVKIAPDWLHNAEWYIGTRMKKERIGDKEVIFNHTKFKK